MQRIRGSFTALRAPWAILLALLLSLRLIGAAGYMPAIEHGRLTLMLCPDGEWTAPAMHMAGHEHMPKHSGTDQCPYAAASAMQAAGADPVVLAEPATFQADLPKPIAASPSRGRPIVLRPPSTGPPFLA